MSCLRVWSQALPAETDVELAHSILRRCQAALMRFLPSGLVNAAADRFYALTRALATTSTSAPASVRTLYTRSMVSFAVTRTGAQRGRRARNAPCRGHHDGHMRAAAEDLALLLSASPPEGSPVLDQGTRWCARRWGVRPHARI